jgi:hypothetical protein
VWQITKFLYVAVLKVNGDELLETRDDGGFLDVFKSFFQSIGEREVTETGRHQIKLTVSVYSR